jgi:hypothetical protein
VNHPYYYLNQWRNRLSPFRRAYRRGYRAGLGAALIEVVPFRKWVGQGSTAFVKQSWPEPKLVCPGDEVQVDCECGGWRYRVRNMTGGAWQETG